MSGRWRHNGAQQRWIRLIWAPTPLAEMSQLAHLKNIFAVLVVINKGFNLGEGCKDKELQPRLPREQTLHGSVVPSQRPLEKHSGYSARA